MDPTPAPALRLPQVETNPRRIEDYTLTLILTNPEPGTLDVGEISDALRMPCSGDGQPPGANHDQLKSEPSLFPLVSSFEKSDNTARMSSLSLYWTFSRPFTLIPPMIGIFSGALIGYGASHVDFPALQVAP